MCTWSMARFAGNLRLRLVRGLLLLLLSLFRPGRHDPVHARVGDGLAEMLAKMSCDHDEGPAQCGLSVEHCLRFIGIRIVEHQNNLAEMSEGILQGLQEFWFVAAQRHDGLRIETERSAGSSRGNQSVR